MASLVFTCDNLGAVGHVAQSWRITKIDHYTPNVGVDIFEHNLLYFDQYSKNVVICHCFNPPL